MIEKAATPGTKVRELVEEADSWGKENFEAWRYVLS
jgi:hypothetical protein